MNKERYEEPKMEFVVLSSEDMVIVTSGSSEFGTGDGKGDM